MPSYCNIACLRSDIDKGGASRSAGSSAKLFLNVSRHDSPIVISVKSQELSVQMRGTYILSIYDRNLQRSRKDLPIVPAFEAIWQPSTPMEVLQLLGCSTRCQVAWGHRAVLVSKISWTSTHTGSVFIFPEAHVFISVHILLFMISFLYNTLVIYKTQGVDLWAIKLDIFTTWLRVAAKNVSRFWHEFKLFPTKLLWVKLRQEPTRLSLLFQIWIEFNFVGLLQLLQQCCRWFNTNKCFPFETTIDR